MIPADLEFSAFHGSIAFLAYTYVYFVICERFRLMTMTRAAHRRTGYGGCRYGTSGNTHGCMSFCTFAKNTTTQRKITILLHCASFSQVQSFPFLNKHRKSYCHSNFYTVPLERLLQLDGLLLALRVQKHLCSSSESHRALQQHSTLSCLGSTIHICSG